MLIDGAMQPRCRQKVPRWLGFDMIACTREQNDLTQFWLDLRWSLETGHAKGRRAVPTLKPGPARARALIVVSSVLSVSWWAGTSMQGGNKPVNRDERAAYWPVPLNRLRHSGEMNGHVDAAFLLEDEPSDVQG